MEKGRERLDKLLSAAGIPRTKGKEMIRKGRVSVNGAVCRDAAAKFSADAEITADGERLHTGEVFLMLHKPAGVISATEDKSQKTVIDLLGDEWRGRGLFPVGRLDKDVTGLVILTGDGELAHRLLSPKHHVDKVYEVTVNGVLTQEDVSAVAAGITLGDGTTCREGVLERTERDNVGILTIREGKYHQVKRMMAALGKPVTALKRLSMGGVTLDEGLLPGEWRHLTEEERRKLEKNP